MTAPLTDARVFCGACGDELTISAAGGAKCAEMCRCFDYNVAEPLRFRAETAERELAQCREEREAAQANAGDALSAKEFAEVRLHNAAAALDAAREALKKYGGHIDGCIDDPCECGLASALAGETHGQDIQG